MKEHTYTVELTRRDVLTCVAGEYAGIAIQQGKAVAKGFFARP